MPCIMDFMLDVQQQQEGRSLNALCLQQALHKGKCSPFPVPHHAGGMALHRLFPATQATWCLQGQWSLALHELFQAYHLAKEEPLVLLCLGVALLQKSMSRKAEDRNKTILQAFAFMQVSSAASMHFSSTAPHPAESGGELLLAIVACWYAASAATYSSRK